MRNAVEMWAACTVSVFNVLYFSVRTKVQEGPGNVLNLRNILKINKRKG